MDDAGQGTDASQPDDAGAAKDTGQDAGPNACLTSADCVDFAATLGPCRKGICDTTTNTCVEAFAAEGSACTDGAACTEGDSCKGGACSGKAKACDDGDACTDDICDPKTGSCGVSGKDLCACQADADCAGEEDGDLCNGTLFCDKSQDPPKCVVNPKTVVSCDTASDTDCLKTACNAKSGQCVPQPAADGTQCDDGSVCSSGDTCTKGSCAGGVIQSCDDNTPCTADTCNPTKGCVHTPNTLPCDDGNKCTEDDACSGGQCAGGKNTCGCEADSDCAKFDDGDACNGALYCDKSGFPFVCKVDAKSVVSCDTSKDTACLKSQCDAKTGACGLQAVADKTPCDDGDKCTVNDACAKGLCTSAEKPNCNDGNPCTEGEACAAGKRKAAKSKSCDDGNVCTFDSCDPLKACQHVNNNSPCDDGDVCTDKDVCKGGTCTAGADVPFCCKSAAQCNDGSACTKDACENNVCVNTPTGQVVFSESFDGDLSKWSFSTDNSSVPWQAVSDKVATPKGKSLYAGNQAKKSYNFGETEAIATLPKMQLPTGTLTLGMHVWIDTEDNDCDFDVLEVRVDGDELHTICPSTKGWKYLQVDLSPFQGREVSLSLAFVIGDNVSNNGEGIYVDNLTIRAGSCGDVACKVDKDCQDLNTCTGDRCVEGKSGSVLDACGCDDSCAEFEDCCPDVVTFCAVEADAGAAEQ